MRTSNPIESTFETVRHRTTKTKGFQHLAFVINRTPRVSCPAIDLHENLVQIPAPTGPRPHPVDAPLTDFRSKHRSKPVPPKLYRLMADLDAELVQQILDFVQREWKAHLQHHPSRMILGEVLK